MSNIEVNTAQNVRIQYELADLKDRAFAFIIDAMVMWTGILILYLCFIGAFGSYRAIYGNYFITYPIFIFYTLVSEVLMDGQTLGKKALKIKVIRVDGNEPVLSDHIVRWSFRMIDIYLSFFSIAAMLVSSTENNQRLGDILSNTVLIRLKPNVNIRLDDVLHIHSMNDYKPQFPQVRQLQEEDMLLVKAVLDRVKKYPNQAHQDAVIDLTKKLVKELNINPIPKNRTVFLKTLINDYIVLTR